MVTLLGNFLVYPGSPFNIIFIAQELKQIRSLKGLKIIHLNARSLLAHWDEISSEFLTLDFDIVVITESWLHSLVSDSLIHKDGYNLFRLDRQTANSQGIIKQGGGICMYIKDNFTVESSNCFAGSNADYEIFHLKISKGFHKRINLIGVYRPPDGRYKTCIDELDRICSEIKSRHDGNLVVLGDFNIDLDEGSHPASKHLIDFGDRNSLVQLVHHSTRVSSKRESKLDLIFSDMNNISISGIIQLNFSDHFPTFIVKKKSRDPKDYTDFTCRNIKRVNWESFNSDLLDHDMVYSDVTDPSLAWEKLKTHIIKVCDVHCPLVTMTRKRVKPEYISDEILEMIHTRDKAYRKARKSKLEIDLIHAKSLRQQVTRLLRNRKREFILKQIDLANGNSKIFWKTINRAFFTKSDPKLNQIWDERWNTLIDGEGAANLVNEYFCNISQTLSSELGPETVEADNFPYKRAFTYPKLDWDSPIDLDEVTYEISIIDTGKSSGYRELNAVLLKQALLCLNVEFTHILNLCRERCWFPDDWKQALVVPIPKKGD